MISEVEKELGKDDSPLPKDALLSLLARAYERLEDSSGALRWYRDYHR